MAVEIKEPQTKELLQRSSIRTMRKDLAKLREEDSLQEKQKISKIKITQEAPAEVVREIKQDLPQVRSFDKAKDSLRSQSDSKSPNSNPVDFALSKQDKLGKILDQFAKEERDAKTKIKGYASETEKQQIFLLQSQRANLENQIEAANTESNSSLMLERNKILIEKEHWQKKLNDVMQEEEKNKKEQETIEDKEKISNVPTEKQALEKEALAKEEQRQDTEKKRWSVESELAKLEAKIKDLDETDRQSQVNQNDIKKEIADIDDSLKIIYDDISKREQANPPLPVSPTKESGGVFAEKPEILPTGKDQTVKPLVPISSRIPDTKTNGMRNISEEIPAVKLTAVPEQSLINDKKSSQDKEYVKDVPFATRPAFAQSSPVAIEKLEKSVQVEETQRRKFMEDVEKWAASEKMKNN